MEWVMVKINCFLERNPFNTKIDSPVSGQTDPHMYKVDFSLFFSY